MPHPMSAPNSIMYPLLFKYTHRCKFYISFCIVFASFLIPKLHWRVINTSHSLKSRPNNTLQHWTKVGRQCHSSFKVGVARVPPLPAPLSIRPSVCHSRSCILSKWVMHIRTNFSPSGNQTILIFPYQALWQYSDGDPNRGVDVM